MVRAWDLQDHDRLQCRYQTQSLTHTSCCTGCLKGQPSSSRAQACSQAAKPSSTRRARQHPHSPGRQAPVWTTAVKASTQGAGLCCCCRRRPAAGGAPDLGVLVRGEALFPGLRGGLQRAQAPSAAAASTCMLTGQDDSSGQRQDQHSSSRGVQGLGCSWELSILSWGQSQAARHASARRAVRSIVDGVQVVYEDGDEEWIDLGKERYSLTQPEGAPAACAAHGTCRLAGHGL